MASEDWAEPFISEKFAFNLQRQYHGPSLTVWLLALSLLSSQVRCCTSSDILKQQSIVAKVRLYNGYWFVIHQPLRVPIYEIWFQATGSGVAATVFMAMLLAALFITSIGSFRSGGLRLTWSFAWDDTIVFPTNVKKTYDSLGVSGWALLFNGVRLGVLGCSPSGFFVRSVLTDPSSKWLLTLYSIQCLHWNSYANRVDIIQLPRALANVARARSKVSANQRPFLQHLYMCKFGWLVNALVVGWTASALVVFSLPVAQPTITASMSTQCNKTVTLSSCWRFMVYYTCLTLAPDGVSFTPELDLLRKNALSRPEYYFSP